VEAKNGFRIGLTHMATILMPSAVCLCAPSSPRAIAEARRELQAEVAIQPRHNQALTYLGDSEMHLGDSESALENLRRVVKLDPNIRLAQLDLGNLLAARHDHAAAEQHLRAAIRLDPSKSDAHYSLGRLLLALGRKEEADAQFAIVKKLATQPQQEPLRDKMQGGRGEPAH
jgi:tetratricopeptide (TPR) repeat protein